MADRAAILPDELRLGTVHLKVSSLTRSLEFYEFVLGFDLIDSGDGEAVFGAGGAALIHLHERPGALHETHHSGLYHVALLYPTRRHLAEAAQRIRMLETPIEGASDHGTHEAIYLPDPDGNGLELAWDRAPEQWPDLSDVTSIAPRPLDFGGLFNIVSGREPVLHVDPETRVGHMHLHVGDIGDSLRFYRDLIGFDLITQIDTAAFVSAGGYHHHLAFNTWQGLGAPPASEDASGLMFWTVELPSDAEVDRVRERLIAAGLAPEADGAGFFIADPSANRLLVTAA